MKSSLNVLTSTALLPWVALVVTMVNAGMGISR
jgi:hypothetical protein